MARVQSFESTSEVELVSETEPTGLHMCMMPHWTPEVCERGHRWNFAAGIGQPREWKFGFSASTHSAFVQLNNLAAYGDFAKGKHGSAQPKRTCSDEELERLDAAVKAASEIKRAIDNVDDLINAQTEIMRGNLNHLLLSLARDSDADKLLRSIQDPNDFDDFIRAYESANAKDYLATVLDCWDRTLSWEIDLPFDDFDDSLWFDFSNEGRINVVIDKLLVLPGGHSCALQFLIKLRSLATRISCREQQGHLELLTDRHKMAVEFIETVLEGWGARKNEWFLDMGLVYRMTLKLTRLRRVPHKNMAVERVVAMRKRLVNRIRKEAVREVAAKVQYVCGNRLPCELTTDVFHWALLAEEIDHRRDTERTRTDWQYNLFSLGALFEEAD